jgi:electron transfer flavoprotein beta subunit
MIPDSAGELELTSDGRGIDREWLDFQLNDFDDHALEEAILLKEAVGATVLAVAVGEGSNRVLQMAVARGADEAVALEAQGDGMIDSRAIAGSIVALARSKAVDLVLCGVQSTEDLFGQLVPYAGALLGWPHVSGSSRVGIEGSALRVTQERGGGIAATYEVALPAVIGVQTASKAPRYVSGSKLREASKTAIGKAPSEPAGFDRSAEIVALRLPDQRGSGENLGDNPENVADRLAIILAAKGFAGV